MNILEETLSEINDVFTSNEFCKVAKQKGYSDYNIKRGAIAKFLHTKCKHQGSNRRWIKKTIIKGPRLTNNVEDSISFLKGKGYRILAPITEWKEL